MGIDDLPAERPELLPREGRLERRGAGGWRQGDTIGCLENGQHDGLAVGGMRDLDWNGKRPADGNRHVLRKDQLRPGTGGTGRHHPQNQVGGSRRELDPAVGSMLVTWNWTP